jgi:hypothetical protein
MTRTRAGRLHIFPVNSISKLCQVTRLRLNFYFNTLLRFVVFMISFTEK